MTLTKREKTRLKLAQISLDLFEEKGYENTTVEEITDRAGVSHMTFFRNFPTRSQVLTAFSDSERIPRFVVKAPLTMGAIETVCWAMTESMRQIVESGEPDSFRVLKVVGSSAALNIEFHGPESVFQQRIAEGLVGRGIDEEEARLATACVVNGVGEAIAIWSENGGEESPVDAVNRIWKLLSTCSRQSETD